MRMTNFEKIKSMTAEEFTDFIYDLNSLECNGCPAKGKCGKYYSCEEAFMGWLNSEFNSKEKWV
jgi:hypothetical protein